MLIAKDNAHQWKVWILILISITGCLSLFFIKRFGQDPDYHLFADTRNIFSVPNFWNVISNFPFLIIGLAGMHSVIKKKPGGILNELSIHYFIFFFGVFFTAIGSAYYHLNPNNGTLLWDRLPMTIAFMSFFSIITGEYVNLRSGKQLLVPLVVLGIFSVIYWNITEKAGNGDLRLYLLVQFLPMLLIPLIVLLFKTKFNTNIYIWLVLLAYILAKIAEAMDLQIFKWGYILSGHTIKHFFGGVAPLIFLIAIFKRRKTIN